MSYLGAVYALVIVVVWALACHHASGDDEL